MVALIHSGDKNSWVWKYWKYYYAKYWDFRIPTVFLSEEKDLNWDQVINIKSGTGPWATTLLNSLDKIHTEYIIYMHEDVFLTNHIEYNTLIELYKLMKTNDLQLIKCSGHDAGWREAENNLPKTDMKVNEEPIYLYPNHIDYLVSHQISIWNKEFFKSTLKCGESPWQHELEGTKRLRARNISIHAFCSEENEPNSRPIPHIEAVRAGKPRTKLAIEMFKKVDDD
jgi:hypothetical protein